MCSPISGAELMGEVGRLAQTETRFYRELAPQLTGLPESYGSAFDSVTGRFVLVLEDLAVDHCEFPDTLHPLTADQASQVVELLAQLHATSWERVTDWAYSMSADTAALVTGPLLKTSVRRLAEKTDVPVERGQPAGLAVRAARSPGPGAGLHADHQHDPGRSTGPSARPAQPLPAGARRRGGQDLDRDDLWDRYRIGALYAYVASSITAGMGGMQVENIAMEGVRRGVAALDELDTVALLQKSL